MGAKRAKKHRAVPAASQPLPLKNDKNALTDQQLAVVLVIGFAFGVGVIYEWGPLNGLPSLTKWGWPWQDLGVLHMGLALLAPFLLIAGVLWAENRASTPNAVFLLLGALVASNFCLQLFSVLADPRGLERVSQIVLSPDATAYYTDALRIEHLGKWLSQFHPASLTGHAKSHPAGPIVFYYIFVRLFGPDAGAFLGGCTVGLLASLGPVIMYSLAGLWSAERRVRLAASALYSLLPALTVFFPEFDQMYPLFSMLIVLTFVSALNAPRHWYLWAVGMGAAVFAGTFFAYNLLTIGVFPLYYGIYWWWRRDDGWKAAVPILRVAAVTLAAATAFYLMLWLSTGYDPLAALHHSLQAMKAANEGLGRAYGISIFADLYDFLLGAGIISAPILFFFIRNLRAEFHANPDTTALTVIALLTILTVDFSGLLRGETSRIWMFLQPLVVVPVAVELARLRLSWRLAIFAMQWWLLVVIKAKMSFVEP